jgi:hypothetical protein
MNKFIVSTFAHVLIGQKYLSVFCLDSILSAIVHVHNTTAIMSLIRRTYNHVY